MWRIWPVILLTFACVVMAADPPQDDEIPALRPPLKAMHPGFWEAHGTQIAIAAVASLLLICVVVALARRRKQSAPVLPEEEARVALRQIRKDHPEDLSAISQITRRGLAGLFGLPRHEMTTAEFCQALDSATPVAGSAEGIPHKTRSFLQRCDTVKFAPGKAGDSWDAAGEALELIDTAVRCSRPAEPETRRT
jgi:hypothetical protein